MKKLGPHPHAVEGPLAVPLSERIEAVRSGRGPVTVAASELATVAEVAPELLDRAWRVQQAAKVGRTGDYAPWLVEIVPDPAPLGPRERKVIAEHEPKLRELEAAIVELRHEREGLEVELAAALGEYRRKRERAANEFKPDGGTTRAEDAARAAKRKLAEIEARLEDVREQEQRLVSRYAFACAERDRDLTIARERDGWDSGRYQA